MTSKAISLILGMAVCATPALASGGSINKQQHREQARINQGIRSGQLTRAEARRLEAQQARIRVNERFDRADGKLSPKERAQLNKQLSNASRDIYRQKHDNQTQK
jgi:tellurite resistance protein